MEPEVNEGCKLAITQEVIRKAVAEEFDLAHDGDVTVGDLKVDIGTVAGDNYACIILVIHFRFGLEGAEPTKEHSYVAKVAPDNVYRAKMLKESGMFASESDFLRRIKPQLQAMRTFHHMKPIRMPNQFYIPKDPQACLIVMENLKAPGKNYQMPLKSLRGLSESRIHLVMQVLAQLHASNYHHIRTCYPGLTADAAAKAFAKGHPEYDRPGGFFDFTNAENREEAIQQVIQFLYSIYMGSAELIKDWNPEVQARMLTCKDTFYQKCMESETRPGRPFLTLIHGDAWYNNMMFKECRDSGDQREEVVLLDFQISRVTSPAVDLAYFFASSTFLEVEPGQMSNTKVKVDEWLATYHKELIGDLVTFGYPEDTYTFAELQADLDQSFWVGLVTGLMHSQMLTVTPGRKVLDLDKIGEDNFGEVSRQLFEFVKDISERKPDYRKKVYSLISQAVERGLF